MAVQVAQKVDGRARILKHFGSAHSEEELAVLMAEAREYKTRPILQAIGIDPTNAV